MMLVDSNSQDSVHVFGRISSRYISRRGFPLTRSGCEIKLSSHPHPLQHSLEAWIFQCPATLSHVRRHKVVIYCLVRNLADFLSSYVSTD